MLGTWLCAVWQARMSEEKELPPSAWPALTTHRHKTSMWRTSRSVLHLPPASDVQMTNSGRRVFFAIVFRIPLWSAVYIPPLCLFLGTKKAQLQRMAISCNGRRIALWEWKRKYFGKRNSMIRLQRHACQSLCLPVFIHSTLTKHHKHDHNVQPEPFNA